MARSTVAVGHYDQVRYSMFPWPSVLRGIELFGDFHRFLNFIEEVDFGCVGADVAEE